MYKKISVLVLSLILVISFSYPVFSQKGRFKVGNEAPTITNFAVQEADGITWDSASLDTHDFLPSFRWTINDKNPDTLTSSICIGTSIGLCDILDAPDFQSTPPGQLPKQIQYDSPVQLPLIQTDCTGNYCSKIYYINVSVNDGENLVTANYQVIIFDNLPAISNIYLSDIAPTSCIDFLPIQNCFVTPTKGNYSSVNLIVKINDIDSDCFGLTHSANAILCLVDASGAELCNPSANANYIYPLGFESVSGTECNFSISVLSGSPQGIEFYKLPGIYKMYINASSQAGFVSNNYKWEYDLLPSYIYPDIVDLGDGEINLGEWNPGTSLAVVTNQGNAVLSLQWQATDPELNGTTIGCSVSNSTCWDLSTDFDLFQIDDDNIHGEVSETGLTPSNIAESSPATFQPSGGLQICDSMTCNSAILKETLDTYFHIAPPIGLEPGIYETTFTFIFQPI